MPSNCTITGTFHEYDIGSSGSGGPVVTGRIPCPVITTTSTTDKPTTAPTITTEELTATTSTITEPLSTTFIPTTLEPTPEPCTSSDCLDEAVKECSATPTQKKSLPVNTPLPVTLKASTPVFLSFKGDSGEYRRRSEVSYGFEFELKNVSGTWLPDDALLDCANSTIYLTDLINSTQRSIKCDAGSQLIFAITGAGNENSSVTAAIKKYEQQIIPSSISGVSTTNIETTTSTITTTSEGLTTTKTPTTTTMTTEEPTTSLISETSTTRSMTNTTSVTIP